MERFPPDFMFELSDNEYNLLKDNLRCQFGTLETTAEDQRGRHAKYMPFAFTEQGVAQLSSVLGSPKAIAVNVEIVRAFVGLRHILLDYNELEHKLALYMQESNMQFSEIYKALGELAEKKAIEEKPRRPIGYVTRASLNRQ
jgi:hypothetical protein